jgi:hypothetical protein
MKRRRIAQKTGYSFDQRRFSRPGRAADSDDKDR